MLNEPLRRADTTSLGGNEPKAEPGMDLGSVEAPAHPAEGTEDPSSVEEWNPGLAKFRLQDEEYRGELENWRPINHHEWTDEQRELAHDEIRSGRLRWHLHPGQLKLLEWADNNKGQDLTILLARQLGKTRAALTYALECCLTKPNFVCKYSAPTEKDAKDIVLPQLKLILQLFPDDLLHQIHKAQNKWTFPNGSTLELRGADGGQMTRGIAISLWIMDECAFMKDMGGFIEANVTPMKIWHRGQVWMISTPNHPEDTFNRRYVAKASVNRTLYHATWRENPMNLHGYMETEILKDYVKPQYPDGWSNPNFLREHEADSSVANTERRVIDEYSAQSDDTWFLKYPGLPKHYRPYVGVDPGYKDHAGLIFAAYDWFAGVLVVLDEWNKPGQTTNNIVETIKTREKALGFKYQKIPTIRVTDHDDKLRNEMIIEHKLMAEAARKNGISKIGMVTKLRDAIADGLIRVHPRCVNLRLQLSQGTWNKDRADYVRTETMGHLDLLDALKMIVLNIDWYEYRREDGTQESWQERQVRDQLESEEPHGIMVTKAPETRLHGSLVGREHGFYSFADVMQSTWKR